MIAPFFVCAFQKSILSKKQKQKKNGDLRNPYVCAKTKVELYKEYRIIKVEVWWVYGPPDIKGFIFHEKKSGPKASERHVAQNQGVPISSVFVTIIIIINIIIAHAVLCVCACVCVCMCMYMCLSSWFGRLVASAHAASA